MLAARSDSDESPAQLLICVNQTTLKGAFVRRLEGQARCFQRLLSRLSSGEGARALREALAALSLPELTDVGLSSRGFGVEAQGFCPRLLS